MRPILALVLAALILAANAPGMFLETPVCAAVDGAPSAVCGHRPATASCCGTPDCPMHAGARCGIAKGAPGTTRLCAPSCGVDGARVAPGVPDPGTIESQGRETELPASRDRRPASPRAAASRSTDPAVPPPRA